MSPRGHAYRLVRPAAPTVPAVRLDDAQRAVVAHTRGPLLVVGGPGTGKTTTLVEAVAARVAAGTDPERILVLTFGRRGATALRHRIEARLTGPGAVVHEPLVRTFHAYAFGLLRRAAAAAGEPPPRLLTGPEQDVIIRELLRSGLDEDDPVAWPERLRAALPTRAFAGQLRDVLLRAAERGIGADQLDELGRRHGRADWQAAARFMREYAQVLALREASTRGSVGYDSAELVQAAVRLLAGDPELLAAHRRQLAGIYVDEFADTDPAERQLLELVGGGLPLVAFADPDSSIFAFRGGDPGGVREFPDRFATAGGPAPTVTLTRSYRAGPELVAAAGRVGRRLRGPARHRRLTAADGGPVARGAAVEVFTFRSAISEQTWLAHRLREVHLREQVPWSRMAVLVRAGHQIPALHRALRTAGVPSVVDTGALPLAAQPAVAPLLLLLRCAVEPDHLDEETALTLLHSPLGGADPLAERQLRQGLRTVAAAAGDRRTSGELLVAVLRDPGRLAAALERRWAAPARAVAALLATAREAAAAPGASAESVLWAVWEASGLAERWAAAAREHADGPWRAEAADRDLDAVVALFDAAARFADRLPGARVEAFLDHVQSQELPGDTLSPTADRSGAVRLLTAHAAKGQEWDLVAVPGVQEGVWPDLRLRGSLLGSEQLVDVHAGRELGVTGRTSALLDEERRLFWVAVTRARSRLLVSAVAAVNVGEAEYAEQPSRFLRELAGSDPAPGAAPDPVPPPDPTGPDRPLLGGAGAGAGAGGAVEAAGADDGAPGLGAGGLDGEGRAAGGHGEAAGRAGPAASPAGPAGALTGPAEPAVPAGRVPRGLNLAALVADLRTAVTDPAAPEGRRRAAAAHLARLARAGVHGADPDQWWGLAPLSDERPLADPGEPVRVTPSTMESVLKCSLRWLLERHGGAAPFTAAQGVGNLVHATAMLADSATVDRSVLVQWMAERFDAIEHAATWLAGTERARAEAMIDKLLRWIAANPRRLVAIEREFSVKLDEGTARPVEITGRVDRLEIDAAGRLVVVDLKTGRSAPAEEDVAAHPQLAGYQAAVAAGAFAELGTEPGGAALVHLGTGTREAREQTQPPPAQTDDPGWADALVRRTAAVMAGATFAAVRNDRCRVCPVRTACPITGQGRQVVEP